MKGNLSRLLRSGVAMLLVVCMVVGFVPATAFANAVEDDSVIHYVSLGASNTNGYGIDGYLPADVYEDPLAASKAELNVYGYNRAPAAAYPAQVAAELKAETGKEVKLHQLAISSMRVEEVRYLLDDTMEPDDYMNWRFTGGEKWFEIAEPGGVPALRKAYRESLAEADYVTVDLGWNNFGVFAFNQIKTIMADGSLWKDIEMSDYMNPEDEPTYQLIKSKAMEMLTGDMTGADEGLKTKLSLMADVLAAATMGACYNYDIVLEKIYELNPDAKVVVINIQNLADDLVIDFEGTSLPLGDLYGELIDFVNLYRASESPYADECIFADVGDVTTFLDELVAWNGDPAALSGDTLDCFDMYDDSLYVRSIVEYMMAGQALSGLFKGFRDMAAGYGLEVFKDDSQYTYAFALSRSVSELLSLDLAKLDFNNPGGADMDVEVYGAAVAKHLKNLRAGKMDAYDYVFTDLSNGIQQQIAGLDKNELQNNKAQLEAAIQQLEAMNAPEDQISGYRAQLEAVNNGLLAFEAVEMIIPAAKAEFHNKYEGVYNTYHNTLNYAYDLVATIFQEAAKINNLEINADSMNGFNNVSDTLMNAIAGSFIGGAQQKFYYELQKNGVQDTGVTEDPGLMVEDVLALLENDAAVRAIAVLAVRYELGNSFFAHPNPAGHDEITSAVMSALENGSDAGDFTDGKIAFYKKILQEIYGSEIAEQVWQQWEANGPTDLVIDDDFKYVAIGDGSAETESYVESLTAALNAEAVENGVDEIEVINYAKAGNTVDQERAALSDVTGADLITVGFSNVEFLAEAVDTAFHGGKFDWAAVVGAENVQYVEQLLAKVAATIAEAGVTGDIADMANDAIEAYAYSVVQYAVELPELVNEIHAANEDALIILIGMYNPLNGVTIDLGDGVALEMDEYMDYLVMGAGVHGVAYSLLSGNSIYVDASEVQTENTKTVYGIRDLMELVTSNYAALYPSVAGDAYIVSKIIEALDIAYLSNHFIDVFPEEWYYDAVLWAVKNDITKGYGQPNTFCPNQDCTRAEIVTFLWRANGCPAPSSAVNPFVDIEEGSWYYDAVLWACEQGITEGYGDNEHFAPNVTCDRAQVATFLHRAKGEPAVNNAANPFIDIEEGTWYTEAVLWAAENEITVGYGEANTFRPELTCTRAQIVTFLYRAYK